MKTVLIAAIGCLTLIASVSVRAEEKEHPCKKIQAACEAAGYKKGDHKKNGKGLFMDCMKKIKDGGSVEGVFVPAEEVNACKENAAKHREKKAAKQQGSPAK